MEAFYAQFEHTSKPMKPHEHAGAEIIYVISGQLVISFDGEETLLEEGDSIIRTPAFATVIGAKARRSARPSLF